MLGCRRIAITLHQKTESMSSFTWTPFSFFFALSFRPLGLADVPEITKAEGRVPLVWCPHQDMNLLAKSSLLVHLLAQPNWNCSSWQGVLFCFSYTILEDVTVIKRHMF